MGRAGTWAGLGILCSQNQKKGGEQGGREQETLLIFLPKGTLYFSKVKIFAHKICANTVQKHEKEGQKDMHSTSQGPGLQAESTWGQKAWAQLLD